MRSADNALGWKSHFERTMRWADRSEKLIVELPASDFHEALDFALVYFVWCHSMRDWLINDAVIKKDALNDQLKSYPEWKTVRDLANRTKHLTLSHGSKDEYWEIHREYVAFAPVLEGRERHHINLFFDGKKYNLLSLIHRTKQMWHSILTENKLLNYQP